MRLARLHRERRHHLIEQDGDVGSIAHAAIPRSLSRKASVLRLREPSGKAAKRLHRVPDLEGRAGAEEEGQILDLADRAQHGGEHHAAGAVELHRFETAERVDACLFERGETLGGGQIGDTVAQLLVKFCRRDGIERGEAMPARMLADHQRVVGVEGVLQGALFDERTEARRHGHPSLRVHRVQRMALKEMADVQPLPRLVARLPRHPSAILMTTAPRRPPRGRTWEYHGEVMGFNTTGWVSLCISWGHWG